MSLKFFTCGDLVNFTAKRDFVDSKLEDIIQSSDVSICNFEAPIYTKDMKAIKKAGPHVYQSGESVKYLNEVGFNMVSLANNHIFDYGQEALENTIDELNAYRVDYIGAGVNFDETYLSKTITKNGISVGIVATAENEFGCLSEDQNRGGYAWIFHDRIEDSIRRLKAQVDSVVLIAHAGVENIDFPIKEWRLRYQRLCDVGVDVIIGHHPHVPQGYEKYNRSMIFYSLGNFYFDTVGYEHKSDDSYSVVLEFEKDGLKDFELVFHKKIEGQTCRVEKNEVSFSIDLLNSLLENDYEQKNTEMCVELLHKYYYGYYEIALGVVPKKMIVLNKLKHLIYRWLFRNRNIENRNLMLLHNIRIDSHRFVVQRALSVISEKVGMK